MKINPSSSGDQQISYIEERYGRAEKLLQGLRTQSLVQNDNLQPRWIKASDCFWYLRSYDLVHNKDFNIAAVKDGVETHKAAIANEYRIVDAKALTNIPAFDHQEFADALTRASGYRFNPENLAIKIVRFTLAPVSVCFIAFDQYWQFDCEQKQCGQINPDIEDGLAKKELLSPDGARIAFVRDNNLWVRNSSGGGEYALTDDGEPLFCYAMPPSAQGVTIDLGYSGINAQWSPDSKKLFTVQRDTRQVKSYPLVKHIPEVGQLRPTVAQVKMAFPGDKDLEQYRLLSIDVVTGQCCDIQYPRLSVGEDDFGFCSISRRAWWANDSQHVYFIDYQGNYQLLSLVEVNPNTGETRIVFEERSSTYLNLQPEYMDSALHRYLQESNELIWWSERSGWGHLYLYDLGSAELKHTITQGKWRVRNILHVDVKNRELLIQTAGRVAEPDTSTAFHRSPYYRDICRVNIDTGELTTLVSTDHDYGVHMSARHIAEHKLELSALPDADKNISGVSPRANYIVTTRSRVDSAPVSLLLSREGKPLMEIESAITTNLPKGWQWPEPVKLLAADNKTVIYGVVFRPSQFSKSNQYPVINMIVGSPWLSAIPVGSFHNSRGYADLFYFQAAALAELGFIVVIINSRGTPLRDKAFQEASYGWIADAVNSEDHRAALEQLASRYAYMDLNRVGIYSPTGYHGGIQNLLLCPDLYSVGVINSLMDSRLTSRTMEHHDKYQGVNGPAEGKRFPEQLIAGWQGKLLLIHSLSNPYFPAAATFRLVEALQNANKDVDLLVVPSNDSLMDSYEQRRAWDYLVRHLQNIEPPKEYQLGAFQW